MLFFQVTVLNISCSDLKLSDLKRCYNSQENKGSHSNRESYSSLMQRGATMMMSLRRKTGPFCRRDVVCLFLKTGRLRGRGYRDSVTFSEPLDPGLPRENVA